MMFPAAGLFSRFAEPKLALGETTGLGGGMGLKDVVSPTGVACFGGVGLGAGIGTD